MPRQFAITIGINHYRYHRYGLGSLKCAENDAVAMQAYLKEIGFEEVYRYSDTSPPIREEPTVPERTNLLTILDSIENQHSLKADDCFWFFFSGHGASQATSDYLMPTDGNPRLLADTAISTNRVIRALKRSGAGNIVLILDMCRNEIPGKAMGNETERLAKQEGIITLFSCSPGQRSYELPRQKQGAFTWALLEALRGECCPTRSNAKDLSRFLRNRVPQLVQQFGQQQIPWLIAEPYEKGTQVLLPSEATPTPATSPTSQPSPTLDKLKADALTATYIDKDLEQAEYLWEQINLLATTPEDRKQALDQIREIGNIRLRLQAPEEPPKRSTPPTFSQPIAPKAPPTRPVPAQPSTPELESEKGIDYTRLRDLLTAGEWKEADKETADRMLEAIGKQHWWYVEHEDPLNVPCKDLKMIDRLWVHYSKGKFGFSVQKHLYVNCGAKLDSNYPGNKLWKEFCDRVGWRRDGKWQAYENLNFDLSLSPTGELPAEVVFRVRGQQSVFRGHRADGEFASSLFSHRNL
ncbi:MAG: GUN4 domain-containing protein [Cyanobacteria bacterium J06638_20]